MICQDFFSVRIFAEILDCQIRDLKVVDFRENLGLPNLGLPDIYHTGNSDRPK